MKALRIVGWALLVAFDIAAVVGLAYGIALSMARA